MSELETMTKELDNESREIILDFVSMCEDLENLISRENTLLLDKGTIAFDGMFVRKISLLEKFEKEIREVLHLAKEKAPDNVALQKVLVDKIQDVRRTLSVNTTFQLRDLKKRTKRMAVLKDSLLNFSQQDKEGESVCR